MCALALRSSRSPLSRVRGARKAPLPGFLEPCDPTLRAHPPDGEGWLYEIKADGYRAQLHLNSGEAKVYSRTGLDWTHKYPAIVNAVAGLQARQAYLDGELCGVGPDGTTSFSIIQLASDSGNAGALTDNNTLSDICRGESGSKLAAVADVRLLFL